MLYDIGTMKIEGLPLFKYINQYVCINKDFHKLYFSVK